MLSKNLLFGKGHQTKMMHTKRIFLVLVLLHVAQSGNGTSIYRQKRIVMYINDPRFSLHSLEKRDVGLDVDKTDTNFETSIGKLHHFAILQINKAVNILSSLLDKVKSLADKTINKLRDTFNSFFRALVDKIKTVIKKAKEAGVIVVDCVKESKDTFMSLPGLLLNDLKQCAKNKINEAKQIIVDAINDVKGTYNDVYHLFVEYKECTAHPICELKIVAGVSKQLLKLPLRIAGYVTQAEQFILTLQTSLQNCAINTLFLTEKRAETIGYDIINCAEKKMNGTSWTQSEDEIQNAINMDAKDIPEAMNVITTVTYETIFALSRLLDQVKTFAEEIISRQRDEFSSFSKALLDKIKDLSEKVKEAGAIENCGKDPENTFKSLSRQLLNELQQCANDKIDEAEKIIIDATSVIEHEFNSMSNTLAGHKKCSWKLFCKFQESKVISEVRKKISHLSEKAKETIAQAERSILTTQTSLQNLANNKLLLTEQKAELIGLDIINCIEKKIVN